MVHLWHLNNQSTESTGKLLTRLFSVCWEYINSSDKVTRNRWLILTFYHNFNGNYKKTYTKYDNTGDFTQYKPSPISLHLSLKLTSNFFHVNKPSWSGHWFVIYVTAITVWKVIVGLTRWEKNWYMKVSMSVTRYYTFRESAS